jgi:hypothetical protein
VCSAIICCHHHRPGVVTAVTMVVKFIFQLSKKNEMKIEIKSTLALTPVVIIIIQLSHAITIAFLNSNFPPCEHMYEIAAHH